MANKVLLKDQLFNSEKVRKLAGEIQRTYRPFKSDRFADEVIAKFPELELKARISWIAVCLKKYLPSDYTRAVGVILEALPTPNNPDLGDDDFGEFIYAPYSEFVAKNGCIRKHLQLSLDTLYQLTQRFSVEDAIRYFINAFPDETLRRLLLWSGDSHYHVRRLCSEGTRPKLPWSQKINIPIAAPLPILKNLYADKTRFVTRSVANHVNDISKVDPSLALETLARWKKSKKQSSKEMSYIIHHALRTLIKQGNPGAMKLIGLNHAPRVHIKKFTVPKQVKMNTALEFSFSIESPEESNVIIDYVIYFQSKVGKLCRKKVFKLSKIKLAQNTPVVVSKRHVLRQHMTTRTLYRGKHRIEVQVNGRLFAGRAFMLR